MSVSVDVISDIQHSLEAEGVLQNIRAQLRASVYDIIVKKRAGRNPAALSPTFLHYANQNNGKIVLALVKELLSTLGLKQSLGVFEVEAGQEYCQTRGDLLNALNIEYCDPSIPLLGLILSDTCKEISSVKISEPNQQRQQPFQDSEFNRKQSFETETETENEDEDQPIVESKSEEKAEPVALAVGPKEEAVGSYPASHDENPETSDLEPEEDLGPETSDVEDFVESDGEDYPEASASTNAATSNISSFRTARVRSGRLGRPIPSVNPVSRRVFIEGDNQEEVERSASAGGSMNINRLGNVAVTRSRAGWDVGGQSTWQDDFEGDALEEKTSPLQKGSQGRYQHSPDSSFDKSESYPSKNDESKRDNDPSFEASEIHDEARSRESPPADELGASHRSNQDEDEDVERNRPDNGRGTKSWLGTDHETDAVVISEDHSDGDDEYGDDQSDFEDEDGAAHANGGTSDADNVEPPIAATEAKFSNWATSRGDNKPEQAPVAKTKEQEDNDDDYNDDDFDDADDDQGEKNAAEDGSADGEVASEIEEIDEMSIGGKSDASDDYFFESGTKKSDPNAASTGSNLFSRTKSGVLEGLPSRQESKKALEEDKSDDDDEYNYFGASNKTPAGGAGRYGDRDAKHNLEALDKRIAAMEATDKDGSLAAIKKDFSSRSTSSSSNVKIDNNSKSKKASKPEKKNSYFDFEDSDEEAHDQLEEGSHHSVASDKDDELEFSVGEKGENGSDSSSSVGSYSFLDHRSDEGKGKSSTAPPLFQTKKAPLDASKNKSPSDSGEFEFSVSDHEVSGAHDPMLTSAGDSKYDYTTTALPPTNKNRRF